MQNRKVFKTVLGVNMCAFCIKYHTELSSSKALELIYLDLDMTWIFRFCFSLYFFMQDCIILWITWKVLDLISRETSFVWMIMCKSVVTDVIYTMNSKKLIFRTAVHKGSSEIIHTFYFLNKVLQYLTFSCQWIGKIQTCIKDAFCFLIVSNIWGENDKRK